MAETNKVSRRIGALLNPSRPVSMEGEDLVVEVQSDFHAKEMTAERNRQVLSEALYAALGIRPRLRFVERGRDPVPAETVPSPPVTDSMADFEEAESIEGGEHDPLELVKKGLGAEVVEERGSG